MHSHFELWQHFKYVFLSLALGQIELTLVQIRSLGFEKKYIYIYIYIYSVAKTTYSLHNNNFVSRGLESTNKKKLIGQLFYATE